jgi:dTDP-D-glucose 4,6-dehydratase
MNKATVIITGGCGFIGHHFAEHFLRNTDWNIVVLDKLTYASNGFERLRDIEAYNDNRVRVFTVDLATGIESDLAIEIGPVDYILHLAAVVYLC